MSNIPAPPTTSLHIYAATTSSKPSRGSSISADPSAPTRSAFCISTRFPQDSCPGPVAPSQPSHLQDSPVSSRHLA